MRPRVATVRVFRPACLALILLAASALPPLAHAQLVVMLPADFAPSAPAPPPPRAPARVKKIRPIGPLAPQPPSGPEDLSAALPPALSADPPLSEIALSSFSSGSAAGGSVRTDTSWVGNLTQNSSSLTVGGTARDENGWGATGLSLDASTMNYLLISARRETGNIASTLFVQFEDAQLRTYLVSVSTSLFSTTALTPVSVPLTAWTVDFGPTQITGWSIGGGGLGTDNFRMTFDTLSFTASAIPEPSTYAVLLGVSTLVLAAWRRQRRPT